MLEAFASLAKPDLGRPGQAWNDPRLLDVAGYSELTSQWAGASFGAGLYRIVSATTGPLLSGLVNDSYPDFAGRAIAFSYDWLGRAFAIDFARKANGEPQILLFEPGTGEALEIPHSLAEFHNQLGELAEPALAHSFFREWSAANRQHLPLPLTSCVGYKVPLFLGGKDRADNLELIDLDVYWSITGQLLKGTASLPAGTTVSEVRRR